jgi:Ca-activated chloride channel family protein
MLLALSRPVFDNGIKENNIETKEIIIAIDVSYSMKATDIKPNRYAFAKQTIKAFLEENPKSEITLLAFTQNALLLSPPTTDHQLIKIALETLNPDYILTKGTSLNNLFKKVAELKSEDKNLLLISDGGEEDNYQKLKKILDTNGIKLTILALGTERGTTIQTKMGLLKDKDGNLVISALNPLLPRLTTNYMEVSSSPEATAKKLAPLLDIETSQKITKPQHNYQELYPLPLIIALILFFILHTKYIKYMLFMISIFGISAEASIFDEYHIKRAYSAYQNQKYSEIEKHINKIEQPSLQSQLILANTEYRLQNYKKAIKIYKSIKSTSQKIKQQLFYNIGNSYAKLKDYDKAKRYYIYALQLGEDSQSLYNLKKIIFKENREKSKLGIANPQSQTSQSSKSDESDKSLDKEKENQQSSASGSSTAGKESNKKTQKEREKKRLILDPTDKKEVHPLSSKVYELINKGYIYETKPW